MKKTDNKNQWIAIVAILLIGAVLGSFILNLDKPVPENKDDREKATISSLTDEEHPNPNDQKDGNNDAAPILLTEQQIQDAGITLQTTKAASIKKVAILSGEIRFNEDKTAHIVPRLAGIVENVPVYLGQHVKKGQMIAVIASPYLSELRSEWQTMQQRLKLAKTTFTREKQLWDAKISAQQDYLEAQQHLQEAEISVQNAKQKLMALNANLSTEGLNRYEIRAPFDGVIVDKHITLGEAVKEDTNIFTLSDLSSVWAEIIVSAKDLNFIQVGKSVKIHASAFDSEAEGTVSYVGSLLGEQTRTAKSHVTLANPAMAWRPGLFITAEIPIQEVEAKITVMSDAIHVIDNQPTVFVRVPDGFVAQPVKVGLSDDSVTEILSGLELNVVYAANGSFTIKAEQGKNSVEED